MAGGLIGPPKRRTGGSSGYRPLSDINVTPFVDVMLVLLIVFMVTAPLLTVGPQITLPKSRTMAASKTKPDVIVSVFTNGRITVGTEEVRLNELGPKLKAATPADHDEPVIEVRGENTVRYDRFYEVVEEIHRNSYRKFRLGVEPLGLAARP